MPNAISLAETGKTLRDVVQGKIQTQEQQNQALIAYNLQMQISELNYLKEYNDKRAEEADKMKVQGMWNAYQTKIAKEYDLEKVQTEHTYDAEQKRLDRESEERRTKMTADTNKSLITATTNIAAREKAAALKEYQSSIQDQINQLQGRNAQINNEIAPKVNPNAWIEKDQPFIFAPDSTRSRLSMEIQSNQSQIDSLQAILRSAQSINPLTTTGQNIESTDPLGLFK